MATLAELQVEVTALTTKFDKAMSDTKGEIKGVSTEATSMSSNVKKMFTGFAVATVLKKLADVSIATIGLASDAEETQNKFDVVYSGISDAANEMAVSLATSYGLSTDGAKSMLSGTGDLLTGLGFTQTAAFDLSEQVLTLGADLASFTNYAGGSEGAAEALTKALLGEREMLKSLGISINEADLNAELLRQTQEGLIFETDKQAKAQATLTLVMNQSQNAMGDFERSQDSFANQTKIAKAAVNDLGVEIGKLLLPSATSATTVFGELTQKLAAFVATHNQLTEISEAFSNGTATLSQKLIIVEKQLQLENETALKLRETYTNNRGKAAENARAALLEQEVKIQGIRNTRDQIQQELEDVTALAEAEAQEKALALQAEQEKQDAKDALIQKYVDQNEAVQKILDGSKSEIELIDEQIEYISALSLAEGQLKEDQFTAIQLLQEKKQTILDEEAEEKQAAIDAELEAEQILADEKLALIEKVQEEQAEAREKEQAEREADLESYASYASSVLGIVDNIYTTQLNNIESAKNSKIAALDEETLGEEAYADAVAQIEYDSALESWKLEKEQLRVSKANSLIEIAINTAIGISKALAQGGLAGIATGALVGVAGAAQAAVVASQPDPEKPTLATGAIVAGSTRGVDVTVGESGNDELILGGGSQGEEILNKFADKINERNGGGSNTIVVNQNNMLNLTDDANMAKVAELLYEPLNKVAQRRGEA